jgi:Rps23 Pro-64 3,4-dihydroxylase Tpa1-like proline 4-hydroxylase
MYISEKPIQPTNIYAGCIAEYENIWDQEKTKKYIEDIESAIDNRESGIIFNKAVSFNHGDPNNLYYNEHRTNYNLGLTDSAKVNESFRIIHNDFYLKSLAALSSYCSIFDIKEEIKFVEQINLLRYQGGQHYDAHYDGGTTTGRSVSPILYINEDYSGGELEFVNFNLKIKPKSGSLYLFPSNYAYRHIAHPVTSGTKYAIVTWLHD